MTSEDNLSTSTGGNLILALDSEDNSEKASIAHEPRTLKGLSLANSKSPSLIFTILKLTSQRQRNTRIDPCIEEVSAAKAKEHNELSNVSNIKICHTKIDSLNSSTLKKEVTALAIPKQLLNSKPNSDKSTNFWSSELNCPIFRLTPNTSAPQKLTFSMSLSSFCRDSDSKILWEPRKTEDIYNTVGEQINQSSVVPVKEKPPTARPKKKETQDENPNSFLIGVNRLRKNPNMKIYCKGGHNDSFITVCKNSKNSEVKPTQHHSKDFRSLFKLEARSIAILKHISNVAFQQEDNALNLKILRYLLHFYQTRALEDDSVFVWYVFEGYYPLEMLLKEPGMEQRPFKILDEFAATYMKIRNENYNPKKKIAISKPVAHYMLASYCRMLYEYSNLQTTAKKNNFILRARFAVFNLEQYANSHKLNLLEDKFNYMKLLHWLFYHESHVLSQYNESIIAARKRAEIGAKGETAIYISNQEQIDEFYQNRRITNPDYLSLLEKSKKSQSFDAVEPQPSRTFRCPVKSCDSSLWDSNFMGHFLHHHCRRLQELWQMDRIIVLVSPAHYTPNQDYCLNMLALQRRPNQKRYTPSRQLNLNLPANRLYFAEHLPCALMLSVVSRDTLVENSNNPDYLIYVFWIASIEDYPDNLSCRVYIYSKTHTSFRCGVRVMDFIRLSQFQDITHLLKHFEGKYIAIDYDTMRTLTNDFTEIIYIDVRYIDKNQKEHIDESGDESQWDY